MRRELKFRYNVALLTIAVVSSRTMYGDTAIWQRAKQLLMDIRRGDPFSWAKMHCCAYCIKEIIALDVMAVSLATPRLFIKDAQN